MYQYPSNFNSPFEPTSLADFAFSDDASQLQLESIVNGRLKFPVFGKNAICIWGAYGSGKSTLALLLPQMLDRSANLVGTMRSPLFSAEKFWELTECAMGNNSVTLLNEINHRSKNQMACSPSGWHYEILDEVDNLTAAAQASLKTTITSANSTIFVMTTNHLNKLDKGIIDRSILVEMNQPKPEALVPIAQRFFQIMGLTGNEVPAEHFEKLAKASRGSMREFGTAVATLGASLGGVI